jgi:flagellar protein FlaG
MDVSSSAELKGQGLPAIPALERESRGKVETRPVEPSGNSGKSGLDERRLQERERQLSSEELAKSVSEIQERLDSMGTKLNFALDESTESIIVQVTNKQSGELVRQIPSEEMLELKVKLENLMGILFDQKV